MRDPDDVNPNWIRPELWPFKEDWDSPNWRKKIKLIDRMVHMRTEQYGFLICPLCKFEHDTRTLVCRFCSYRLMTDLEDNF